jgi:hypothetical protein
MADGRFRNPGIGGMIPRMRRTVGVLAASSLAAVAFAAVGPSVTSGRPLPTLRIVGLQPLTVAGRGFGAREHVRVTAQAEGATQTVAVTALRGGTFRVTFAGLTASRCDMVRVVAIRRPGTLVVLKRLPMPACSPG